MSNRLRVREEQDAREVFAPVRSLERALEVEGIRGQIIGRETVLGFPEREISAITEERAILGVDDGRE